ncbi:MAG TPA: hypothetical protein VNV42_13995 [Solirubrobacteraceae bacterium]|nr:hypothetical protein [Solirubrobacteraceae bacterium]
MARLLIVGGGCRGEQLAEEAVGEAHAARIVTRAEGRRARIEAVGAECLIGDPNRLGTLRGALEGVTIACWLLGTASGPDEQLRELHGARLRAFLESAIDTTVRGVLYEAAGTVAEATLAAGERIAAEVAGANAMPLAILRSDPRELPGWLERARATVDSLLGSSPPAPVPDTLSWSNHP